MKNAVIGIVVVGVLAVVGFFALSGSGGNGQNNQTGEQPTTQEAPVQSQDDQMADTQQLPQHVRDANTREIRNATGQAEVTVEAGDNFFNPTVLTISKGTKVTWKNIGNIDHTVTSSEGSPKSGLDSGTLKAGETYSFTFDEVGDYNYFCEFHAAKMKGVVTVTE